MKKTGILLGLMTAGMMLLTGCTGNADTLPSPSPSATGMPTGTPRPAATGSPMESAAPGAAGMQEGMAAAGVNSVEDARRVSGQIAEELSHESFRDLIADLLMMRFTVSFDFELGSVIGQINNVGNAMTQTDQQGSQRIDLKA